MNHPFARLLLTTTFLTLLAACAPDSTPEPAESTTAAPTQAPEAEPTPEPTEDLAEQVARMGAIGYSYGGVFSPDGQRIAFITNASGVPNVWMANTDGSGLKQVTHSEDQVNGVSWNPVNDTLAVDIAPGGGLNRQLYLLPAEGGEMKMITAGGRVNNWLSGWSDDGRLLRYSSSAENEAGMDCWLHDTQTGENRLIAINQGIGWCQLSPDATQAVVWRMVSRGNTNLYLVDVQSGTEQLLTPHVGVALSQSPLWLDNDTVVFASNVDREMLALARVEITDGKPGELEFLAGRDDAELASMDKLADGRLLLNWNAAGRSELAYFDPATGEMTPGPKLPAEIAGGPEVSEDGQQVVITVSGSATPTNVWRLDPASGAFTQISQTPHEGVDLDSLVSPVLKTYNAHDGLELSGWYYAPRGAEVPGPMVLSFHGGPEGQSRPSFRATFQALLSRGIALFVPNVRGSAGFGKTFVNLDNGALRFDGIKDIESTVKFVTEANLAEAGRIGIMGGSYGGYMVMAGLTDYPDLFAAGANLFGVVNFETFFANTEPWMAAISTVEYGDPVKDKELLEQLSPIHKVDRVIAPTIVLHGANDTNVPVVEAEQVVENLQERGVPVKYVLFPDEGHGWGKVENRVTSDVEIVRWFEEHL
ncbi:MAG: S9 family peptidase [Gammaproteobacteria bacterium]|nr:S9 family peptidase [Gammaproteobacteria bacterium]